MIRDEQDQLEATPAQRRREWERTAARESILSAALDVARRDGWDAVTVRRLAEEIAYSANFAYRYFTGRDDILLNLVRQGFTRLRDAMATAAEHPGSRTHSPVRPRRFQRFRLDRSGGTARRACLPRLRDG